MIAAALCVGTGLRLVVTLPFGLWEDEIIAVTHAVQPLPYFFVEVVRNDIHPPLYFLQLHVWGWASHTDTWFVANSVVWSFLAMLSLWLVLRPAGSLLAWTATACLAALPASVWMSQEVRPYAWLSVLFIWAYAWVVRSFAAPQSSIRNYGVLLGFCVLIIASHAIGFFALVFHGLFGLGLLLRRQATRREYIAWTLVFGLAAIASAPMLASNLLHDANLGEAASAFDVFDYASVVVTAASPGRWVWWAGLLAYGGLAGAGLAYARTRLMTACFLVAPLLVAFGLGVTLKPIFKFNFFATMLLPFFAIVLAELCLRLTRWRVPVTAACLAGLLVLAGVAWDNKVWSSGFRRATADIRASLRPGDVVYVPQQSMFEGMAWYLAGPDWGSPLEVANPPNPEWRHVYDLLGSKLVALLHLMPTTQTVALPDGVTLLVGPDSLPQAAKASRVWMVTYPRADLPSGLPPGHLGALLPERDGRYGLLRLSLFE